MVKKSPLVVRVPKTEQTMSKKVVITENQIFACNKVLLTISRLLTKKPMKITVKIPLNITGVKTNEKSQKLIQKP
jgi:hypothetical protein